LEAYDPNSVRMLISMAAVSNNDRHS